MTWLTRETGAEAEHEGLGRLGTAVERTPRRARNLRFVVGMLMSAGFAVLMGACGQVISDPGWERSDRAALGSFELADPRALQAFGFRTEVVLPQESYGIARNLHVTTLTEWQGGTEANGTTGIPGVGLYLHPCPGGQRMWGDDPAWPVFEIPRDEEMPVETGCAQPTTGEWLVVVGRSDAWGPAASGTVTGAPTVDLTAHEFGTPAPPEGFELDVAPLETWHREVVLGDLRLEVPVGEAPEVAREVRVTVSSAANVVAFVSAEVVVDWEAGATSPPALHGEVLGAGLGELGWSDGLTRGERFANSAPLFDPETGEAGAGEWTLRLRVSADSALETPVEAQWSLQVEVFGLGETPPEDLGVEVVPSA